MEVHAHSHTVPDPDSSSSPGHRALRKKWTHYLWEFLMLFLAVFCGFLAEYQLEHKIEKERERVYITSMIEDLKKDTASLSFTIHRYEKMVKGLDTVLNLYSSLVKGYNPALWRNLPNGFPDFIKSDKTMQQLLYAGGLRLIKNTKSSDGIIEYDLQYDDLNIDINSLREVYYKCLGSRWELLNVAAMEEDKKRFSIADLTASENNYLLRTDLPFLGKYNNELRTFRAICKLIKGKQVKMRDKAVELIKILGKEYRLSERTPREK